MFLMKNLHFYQKASRSCDPLNQIQHWNVFLYQSNDRRGDEETHLGIRSSSQAVLTNQDGEAQDGFGLALCFCLQIY